MTSASGETLFARAERTERLREKLRGLLGRDGLADEESLWIDRCDSVHTFAMTFPIDLAYLDREGTIRKVVERLRPGRVSACFRAAATLEMRAGSVERLSLRRGDRIHWADEGDPRSEVAS
ncbi:MAG: DUF192 domain-containing protein [Myxococcota bacterium]